MFGRVAKGDAGRLEHMSIDPVLAMLFEQSSHDQPSSQLSVGEANAPLHETASYHDGMASVCE